MQGVPDAPKGPAKRAPVSASHGPLQYAAQVCMGLGKDTEHVVRQLKRYFVTVGVAQAIRCDNGPPFFSMAFNAFCKDYCIDLQLTFPYNPESSGGAERGASLVKNIMKKTKEEGSCFEEGREEEGREWLLPQPVVLLQELAVLKHSEPSD